MAPPYDGGGGVYVEGGSYTFNMSGGSIYGNEAKGAYGDGAGVYVWNGTFNMSDTAHIYSNKATRNGGGVCVYGAVGDHAVFTMTGGTIGGEGSANTAAYGGGVLVWNIGDNSTATFTMSDGTISYNIASYSEGSYGGGVMLRNSVFNMSGGTISNNSADCGGGVEVYATDSTDKAKFTMSGTAVIKDNTAFDETTSAVDVTVGTFAMEGGTLSGNVYNYDGTISISGGYLDGSIGDCDGSEGTHETEDDYHTNGTIYITGGYLSLTAYGSVSTSWLTDSESGTYLIVNLGEFAADYTVTTIDTNYNSSYPYAVYATGSVTVKDVEVEYGADYDVVESGSYNYVIYKWDGNTYTDLPATTAIADYDVTAIYITVDDGVYYANEYEISIDVIRATAGNVLISVDGSLGKTYDSYAVSGDDLTVTVTVNGIAVEDAVITYTWYKSGDSTPLSGAPADAGTYTVVVSVVGTDNYVGKDAQGPSFTILQLDISNATITLEAAELTYNGEEQSVTVVSVYVGDILVDSYTVDGDLSATEIGEYTLTITGTGNFTGTATTSWSIVSDDGGLGALAIAGIAAGSVLLVALEVALALFFLLKKKKKKEE